MALEPQPVSQNNSELEKSVPANQDSSAEHLFAGTEPRDYDPKDPPRFNEWVRVRGGDLLEEEDRPTTPGTLGLTREQRMQARREAAMRSRRPKIIACVIGVVLLGLWWKSRPAPSGVPRVPGPVHQVKPRGVKPHGSQPAGSKPSGAKPADVNSVGTESVRSRRLETNGVHSGNAMHRTPGLPSSDAVENAEPTVAEAPVRRALDPAAALRRPPPAADGNGMGFQQPHAAPPAPSFSGAHRSAGYGSESHRRKPRLPGAKSPGSHDSQGLTKT